MSRNTVIYGRTVNRQYNDTSPRAIIEVEIVQRFARNILGAQGHGRSMGDHGGNTTYGVGGCIVPQELPVSGRTGTMPVYEYWLHSDGPSR